MDLSRFRGVHRVGKGTVIGARWRDSASAGPLLILTLRDQVIVRDVDDDELVGHWALSGAGGCTFSHPAIHVRERRRYVAVRGGSTLLSWSEHDTDLEGCPSAAASAGVVHLHQSTCGRAAVAVLRGGAVAAYDSQLRPLGEAPSPAGRTSRVLWSQVCGESLFLIEEKGAGARQHLRLVALTEQPAPAGTPGVLPQSRGAAELRKPEGCGPFAAPQDATMHDATSLSVLWPTSDGGCAWSRYSLSAGAASLNATLEFSRVVGVPLAAAITACATAAATGTVAPSPAPRAAAGRRADKVGKGKARLSVSAGESACATNPLVGESEDTARIVACAAVGPAQLLLLERGRGGDDPSPLLSLWDASFGICIADRVQATGALPATAATRLLMSRSGSGGSGGVSSGQIALLGPDGAAVGIMAVSCGADMASLVVHTARKRRAAAAAAVAGIAETAAGAAGGGGERAAAAAGPATAGGAPFVPVVQMSLAAAELIDGSGFVDADAWRETVLARGDAADAATVAALEAAATADDAAAFAAALSAHKAAAVAAAAPPNAAAKAIAAKKLCGGGGSGGSKALLSKPPSKATFLSQSVVDAVVRCSLRHPGGAATDSLVTVLKSGKVSARRHPRLVAHVVRQKRPDLLETALLCVADVQEADVVRIVRGVLAAAASGRRALAPAAEAPGASSFGGAAVAAEAKGADAAAKAAAAAAGASEAIAAGKEKKKAAAAAAEAAAAGAAEAAEAGRGRKRAKRGEAETAPKGKSPAKLRQELATPEKSAKAIGSEMNGTAKGAHPMMNGGMNGHAHGLSDSCSVDEGASAKAAPAAGPGAAMEAAARAATVAEAPPAKEMSKTAAKAVARAAAKAAAKVAKAAAKAAAKEAAAAGGKKRKRGETAVEAVDRCIRVALAAPHNPAFLRAALATFTRPETLLLLRALKRTATYGLTREDTAPNQLRFAYEGQAHPPSVAAVVDWIAALLDAQFSQLAAGGGGARGGSGGSGGGGTDGVVAVAALLEDLRAWLGSQMGLCEALQHVSCLTAYLSQPGAGRVRRRAVTDYSLEALKFG
ncbi:unnamed protein product [Phaeothamnion confervicola]